MEAGTKKMYCWLSIRDGKFSNSWSEEEHKQEGDYFDNERTTKANNDGFKLIEFTCVNDPKFEFTKHMKLK